MMNYSEPWEIELRSLTGYTTIEDSDGTWICQPKDANAERIVACVNFCKGYSNEELETMQSLKATGELANTLIDRINEENSLMRAYLTEYVHLKAWYLIVEKQHIYQTIVPIVLREQALRFLKEGLPNGSTTL